jgi:hypothetical protein
LAKFPFKTLLPYTRTSGGPGGLKLKAQGLYDYLLRVAPGRRIYPTVARDKEKGYLSGDRSALASVIARAKEARGIIVVVEPTRLMRPEEYKTDGQSLGNASDWAELAARLGGVRWASVADPGAPSTWLGQMKILTGGAGRGGRPPIPDKKVAEVLTRFRFIVWDGDFGCAKKWYPPLAVVARKFRLNNKTIRGFLKRLSPGGRTWLNEFLEDARELEKNEWLLRPFATMLRLRSAGAG